MESLWEFQTCTIFNYFDDASFLLALFLYFHLDLYWHHHPY